MSDNEYCNAVMVYQKALWNGDLPEIDAARCALEHAGVSDEDMNELSDTIIILNSTIKNDVFRVREVFESKYRAITRKLHNVCVTAA